MGAKSKGRKSLPENRGLFNADTITTERQWVVRAMRRGMLASVIFGGIAFAVGGLPYTAIVGLLCAVLALGLGWWLILDKLLPFGESVSEFNKHMEVNPWHSDYRT